MRVTELKTGQTESERSQETGVQWISVYVEDWGWGRRTRTVRQRVWDEIKRSKNSKLYNRSITKQITERRDRSYLGGNIK